MCSTSDNSEYEIPPSAPSKLPLVASSRRQLLIFAERCGKFCRRRKGKIPDQRITPHPCGVKTEKTVGRPNIGVMPF